MRIGLIADIHGNLVALDTVLACLAAEGVDEIICLGDVAALGPQPVEVLTRLRALRCPVVMGNTDAWLLNFPTDEFSDDAANRAMRAITEWCDARLSPADRAYLGTFTAAIERDLGAAGTMLCFHGSPRSYDDTIVATTGESDLDRMIAETAATLLVGAHTHIQMMRRYRHARLVNVGSVGLPGIGAARPYNDNVRWAEYATVEADASGLAVSLHRVALDVAAMVARARICGMPHLEWWAGTWGSG